jgi:hypothetical protein
LGREFRDDSRFRYDTIQEVRQVQEKCDLCMSSTHDMTALETTQDFGQELLEG